MNRDMRQYGLLMRFTRWWAVRIVRPLRDVVDALKLRKEKLLTRIFLSNDPGRWVYNHMSANAWTWTRFGCSWIPGTLIVTGHPIIACIAYVVIWVTDVFDGWFARTKNQVTDWGMRLETTVDTIYKIITFSACIYAYHSGQWPLGIAMVLELIKIGGALVIRRNGFKPGTNRSGKTKPWFYAAGVGALLLFNAPTAANLFIIPGIALSSYSLVMHYVEYVHWRHHTRH